MSAGSVSGSGGVEPPLASSLGVGDDQKPTDSGAPVKQSPMMNLRNYFIEKKGEAEGVKAYNQFMMSAFIMPTIQQMQRDEQRLKESEDQMMG